MSRGAIAWCIFAWLHLSLWNSLYGYGRIYLYHSSGFPISPIVIISDTESTSPVESHFTIQEAPQYLFLLVTSLLESPSSAGSHFRNEEGWYAEPSAPSPISSMRRNFPSVFLDHSTKRTWVKSLFLARGRRWINLIWLNSIHSYYRLVHFARTVVAISILIVSTYTVIFEQTLGNMWFQYILHTTLKNTTHSNKLDKLDQSIGTRKLTEKEFE